MTTWATLGDITFDLFSAPTDFQAKDGFHFAEHKMARGKPKLQAIGADLQELTVQCKLHSGVNSFPELDMRSWRDSMQAGEPLPLTIWGVNDGIYAGRLVIERLEHKINQYTADGRWQDVDVTLTLKEWVDEDPLQILPARPRGIGRKKASEPDPPDAKDTTITSKDGSGFTGKLVGGGVKP